MLVELTVAEQRYRAVLAVLGRFAGRDVEVLFDRICRENGITHRLTAPYSPTTTGKIGED